MTESIFFSPPAFRAIFAHLVDDDLVWIGDAKSKSWDSMQLGDYQRFLTYVLDLLSPGQVGTILYAEQEKPSQRQVVRDLEVQHVPLRPGERERAEQELRSLFEPNIDIF